MLNFGKQRKGNPGKRKDVGEMDFYKFYKQNSSKPVDKRTFTDFSKKLGAGIVRLITFDGVDVIFPWRLGSVYLKRVESKIYFNEDGTIDKRKNRIDWERTLKHWEVIYPNLSMDEIRSIPNKKCFYHLNGHSDGYKYRWYWDKVTSNVKNQNFYNFKPVRSIKRELTEYIRITNNKVKCYE